MPTESPEPPESDGRTPFESHHELIERVIAYVCARNRLRAADAEEFASYVRLKLIEDDCAVLRRFEGRSSLQTFLGIVIQRLFLDYRIREWGKWRPSAAARRAGPDAILLERLLTRDGLSLQDAGEVMAAHHGVRLSPEELERLAALLPARARRTREHETVLRRLPSPDPSPEELAMASDRQADAERLLAALDRAVDALDPPDRLALAMRFHEGRTVAEIARITGTEPRRLYARMARLFSEIRRTLEADGFDRAAVHDLLGRLDPPGTDVMRSPERPALRPSMAKGL
ncbi:MAG TPA: sigma-70 family RNA polymerase sigma factor [Vicinamibacterales bacterium]